MNSSIMNDFDDYMLSRNIKFLVTELSKLPLRRKIIKLLNERNNFFIS